MLKQKENKDTHQIFGYIERITFHNNENGYTVAHLKAQKRKDLVCIVGYLPGIKPGQTIRCDGSWKHHMIHGQQFEISKFQVEAPADLIGIKKYLGSGLIKGIGHKYASNIVEKFGIDTLNIIDNTPERLLEVPGLGAKRVEKIKTCWTEQKSIREVMVFLQTYGVSPAFAQKIFRAYGKQCIEKVKNNPFHLARDIFGIGFKSADAIAQKMGIAKESEVRIDAGVEYVLSQLSNDGHVCYPVDEFLNEAEKLLESPQEKIRERLPILQQEQRIELAQRLDNGKQRPFIWLRTLYLSELGIGKELLRLKKGQSTLRQANLEKAIAWVQEQQNIQLAQNQIEAIKQALLGKTHIITGGPGTGKSTITNSILKIFEILTSKIFLAAPTGRAAKRMSEITGKKALTIHRLLEFDFKNGGFKRNRQNPLDCDLVIIDEASMIDTQLMNSLLKAIPDHSRIIFVGDVDQLPSVGPGNVLKDMIESHGLSVTILNEIFRQAAGSAIITNAHRINKGVYPNLYNGPNSDFFFMECQEPEEVLNTIIKLVYQRLPNKYGFNPKQDIQVLTPMRKGVIGTQNLNHHLQKILNPNQQGLHHGGQSFNVGDKVMQIRNNYDKEVFNGDIGYILEIDSVDQQLVVQFDDKIVEYDFDELDELVLAYAISVHKFQGSQCLCLVMPIHTSHFLMLRRNLIYTGITRGQKLVVLVGTKKAMAIAVSNDDVKKRYTSLKQTLMELL